MDFKSMKIEDIINWCKENNKVDWLKAEIQKTEKVERHTGKVKVVNEDGKTVTKVDKNSPVEVKEERISFITLKYNFCKEFMPELIKKEDKKPSMYDLIMGL